MPDEIPPPPDEPDYAGVGTPVFDALSVEYLKKQMANWPQAPDDSSGTPSDDPVIRRPQENL